MSTLGEIAKIINGSVIGDNKIVINGVSTIDNSISGTITFISNSKYVKYLDSTKASAIITNDKALIDKKNGILVDNPRLAIIKVIEHFSMNETTKIGIHDSAVIHPKAVIGDQICIGPNTVIEEGAFIKDNVTIGANNIIGKNVTLGYSSKVYGNVHIYQDSQIGEGCIIHSGSVIGADGYGFVTENDIHNKIPHLGKVIIGNNVEIGANCTIDRGTIGDTIIEDMCKFDNGVQIGHNVYLGKGCLLTAHVTIAGSTKIGEFCVFGGQAGAIDNITIGDRAVFACYTAVTKNLPGGKIYSGSPAREINDKNKRDAVYVEVQHLKKRLKKIEKDFINKN